jgi:hypothetical protein
MPRSQAQSDFVITQPPIEEPVELPEGAKAILLPIAKRPSNEASARMTRIVLAITMIMLALGTILVAVGPHIPSGE